MADAKNPPSFHDAIANAAQAIAGSINAPDYDPKFAGMIIDVMHKFVTMPKQGQGGSPGQPPAGGGPSPAGGPPSPADAGAPGGAPGGVGAPPGAGGPGGPPQPGSGAQTPPAAPTPGGMTQGLSPSPDELRRVLADVAGK